MNHNYHDLIQPDPFHSLHKMLKTFHANLAKFLSDRNIIEITESAMKLNFMQCIAIEKQETFCFHNKPLAVAAFQLR